MPIRETAAVSPQDRKQFSTALRRFQHPPLAISQSPKRLPEAAVIFRIATLRCIFARDGESKWKSRLLESGLKHMGRSRKRRSSMAIPKTDRPPGRTEALARTDVQSLKGTFSIAEALVWITLAVLCAFSLGTLVYPMVRAFYRFPINYNEGWNVYTTQGHAASALVLSEVWLDHGQLSIPVVLLGWICVAFYRRLLIDGSFAFARGASRLVCAGRAHC